jgi:hypothetical protein
MKIGSLWTLPIRLLKARGTFLGVEPDKVVNAVNLARSFFGLLILAGVALAYPGYTSLMEELVPTSENTPTNEVIALKLADSALTSTLVGLIIFLLCFFPFAALMTILTRSGHRLAVLRHMGIPLISFVLFVGLMSLIVGAIDLLGFLSGGFDAFTTSADLHQVGPLLIGVVELVVVGILFIIAAPILVVWYLEALYMAAADFFRADDAHPLLAPVVATVVAWALAGIAWLAGGPTGVPYWLKWTLLLGGPLGVSAISIFTCWRLWRQYHDVLFRDGPRDTAPEHSAGAWQVPIVSAFIAALGPLTALYVIFGPLTAILATAGIYLAPASGPVSLDWSTTMGYSGYSSPAVVGGAVYIGSKSGAVYDLDAATGQVRWSYRTGGPIESSPAVVDGEVYVGSIDDRVYALDAATGRLRWSYTTGGFVYSSPAVVGGMVYIGSNDGAVYALDAATGRVRWSYTTGPAAGSAVYSSPAVVGSEVYVGSNDGAIYALTSGG